MLRQIRDEQNKTNTRIDTMDKRIDEIYDDGYDYDDYESENAEEMDNTTHHNTEGESPPKNRNWMRQYLVL